MPRESAKCRRTPGRPTQAAPVPIKAAVLRRRGGPLAIEPLALEGPRPDEVLVRIVASGVCRTDIDYCDHWFEGPEALVLGHEGAGVVERAGRRVQGVRPGDPVLLSFQSCGRCRPCKNGRPTDCTRFWEANFGFQRLDGSNALAASGVRGHFFGQSSFASHALAVKVLNPGGSLALMTGEGGGPLPGGRRSVGIREGGAVPQRFIPHLIELYRAGKFPFDRLVTFYPFEDIERAMDDARRGAAIKPVLRMGR